MSDDITVTLEDNEPDIVVVLENDAPDVEVVVSDVGLVGPPGPPGPPGPAGADTEASLNAHINSPTPHPVYDDTDLVIFYENAKV